jgi:hypothetical protein
MDAMNKAARHYDVSAEIDQPATKKLREQTSA